LPEAVSDAGIKVAGTAAGEAAGDCCITPGLNVVVIIGSGLVGLSVATDGDTN